MKKKKYRMDVTYNPEEYNSSKIEEIVGVEPFGLGMNGEDEYVCEFNFSTELSRQIAINKIKRANLPVKIIIC